MSKGEYINSYGYGWGAQSGGGRRAQIKVEGRWGSVVMGSAWYEMAPERRWYFRLVLQSLLSHTAKHIATRPAIDIGSQLANPEGMRLPHHDGSPCAVPRPFLWVAVASIR